MMHKHETLPLASHVTVLFNMPLLAGKGVKHGCLHGCMVITVYAYSIKL